MGLLLDTQKDLRDVAGGLKLQMCQCQCMTIDNFLVSNCLQLLSTMYVVLCWLTSPLIRHSQPNMWRIGEVVRARLGHVSQNFCKGCIFHRSRIIWTLFERQRGQDFCSVSISALHILYTCIAVNAVYIDHRMACQSV